MERKPGKPASILDVSRMAGVSIATVSRVIHQNGRFSAATEARVRSAMAALDYVPNPIAQSMHRKRSMLVGILVPDLLDETYALMIRTVQEELMPLGYLVEIFCTRERAETAQQLIRKLVSQKAGGLLYVPDSLRSDQPLDFYGIPTVFFERRPLCEPGTRHVQILFDDAGYGREAMEKLYAGGCRRPLLVGDRLGISSQTDRMEGALHAMEAHALQPSAILRVDPQRSTEAREAVDAAIRENADFDGILCTSGRLTVGALAALKAHSIPSSRCPVAGIGEHRLHQYGLLDYIAIPEPVYERSLAAARAMQELMEGEPR